MTTTLTLPKLMRPVRRIMSGADGIRTLHQMNRQQRNERYLKRIMSKGFRIHAIGQPWVGGVA